MSAGDAGVGDDLAPAGDDEVAGGCPAGSLIRWLETRTARPSAARAAQECPHPGDALGVHAVERLVHHQRRRVAE